MVMINSLGSEEAPRRHGAAGPPPPVPPRPSKSVVAEALAKTRLFKETISRSPTRKAPPPPTPLKGTTELQKSHSSIIVHLNLKKPTFERSLSEELKNYPRPVVYQSNNVKNKNSETYIQHVNCEIYKIGNTSKKPDSLCEIPASDKNEIEDNFPVNVSGENSTRTESISEVKLECDSEGVIAFEGDCVVSAGEEGPSSAIESTCWDQPLKDRNHVNTLIEEMFASVLEVQPDTDDPNNNSFEVSSDHTAHTVIGREKSSEVVIVNSDKVQVENFPKTVILIKNEDTNITDRSNEIGKQVKFVDQTNHEQLISELECMKKDQEKILRRQRKPSKNIYEEQGILNNTDNYCTGGSLKIQRPNRLDLSKVTLERKTSFKTREEIKESRTNSERSPGMSSIHGLPPLPKSLSGFNLSELNSLTHHYAQQSQLPPTPMRTSSKIRQSQQQPVLTPSQSRKSPSTALEAKLALLRQEMYSLRQLDLLLLGKLWSLNESIQDFRQLLMLQDEQVEVLSPPSPSPSSPSPSSPAPSSADDNEGDFYMSALSLDYRTAPQPPGSSATRVSRRPSCSSDASSR